MSTLIKNGRIVTAEQDYTADIHIDGEKITTIGTDLNIPGASVIDANGKYVIPGGIDVHTHLDMPFGGTMSSDDFETGTRAAAFGGTTCVVDFSIQTRGKSLRDGIETWRKKGEKATTDFGLHLIVIDLSNGQIDEMSDIVREGVTSFKLFMAYPNVLMVDDGLIFKVMQKAETIGATIMMHAENGYAIDVLVQQAIAANNRDPIYHALTRPPAAEGEATHRAVALAEMAKVPIYIVHLTCNDALTKVEAAQDRGVKAFAETCIQYLTLDVDELRRPNFEGAKFVFSPPLREKWHQEKLWNGLRKNVLSAVSTDHCPFNFKGQKELGRESFSKIPNGGPAIENRLQLLFHHGVNGGRMTPSRWVELCSTNPAKLFGMYPRKGSIAAGSDADIVIWDPNAEHTIAAATHHMRVDYSMFEGWKVKGNAETVLSRGAVIVDKGTWRGRAGYGTFVKRDAYAGTWK